MRETRSTKNIPKLKPATLDKSPKERKMRERAEPMKNESCEGSRNNRNEEKNRENIRAKEERKRVNGVATLLLSF